MSTASSKRSLLTCAESVLSYDFCPWANRWVYWLKNPLWCLVLATGVSIVCGLFVNPQVFLLTGVLALVASLGTVWPHICMRGIRCQIEFDKRRAREGEVVPVKLTITNRWPWPVWGMSLIDGFESLSDGDSQTGAISLARVSGWSAMTFDWSFQPSQRGVYPTQRPTIETGFPFGIVRSKRPAECGSSLIVWPKTVALTTMPDATDSRVSEDQLTDRRAGDFGDMLGTRLFRQGDSLRRVHWAQTARQREMIVVERQAAATTAVRITLRLDRAVDREAFERTVRVAASICESLYRQHAYVECLIDDTLHVCGGSETEFRRLMDAFARLRVDDVDSGRSSGCSSARRISGLLEIVVTTDGRLEASQHAAAQRMVLVQSADDNGASHVCPWLKVAGDADWSRQLPQLWRRACHAA